MKRNLVRAPKSLEGTVVKTIEDAKELVQNFGLPSEMSLEADSDQFIEGLEESGYDLKKVKIYSKKQ